MPYFVLLDQACNGPAALMQNLEYSDFLHPDNLNDLDGLLAQGWRRGLHLFLAADYDFGLPPHNLPATEGGILALHWFAGKQNTDAATWLAAHEDGGPAGISRPQISRSREEYLNDIAEIQAAIARGDCYQINHTVRLHLNAYGDPVRLYRRLRQPVPHAALACLPDENGGETWTLCFSPELFLNISPDGLITAEPMKGTAPILNDGRDGQRAAELQSDPKNRAENVMIVDLLRNDLGKIAQTGGVRVPAPFTVRPFGGVWQMTSRIEARAKTGTTAADLFRAAFPCGSITGAPKRKSMEIIGALETEPRGLYTGSIGCLQPCAGGLGFSGTLNVVIRTLQLSPAPPASGLPPYRAVYGVGSGIVADSDPEGEYRECGWKARFLTGLAPEFGLFETMRAEKGRIALLDNHLNRLKTSAAALNLNFPDDAEQQIRRRLAGLPDQGAYRVKAALFPDGLRLEHAPLPDLPPAPDIILSDTPLPDCDYLRRFKTTRRETLDQGWRQAEAQGAFDSLFFNRAGELLEGGRSSVFVRFGGEWHTPPLELDILDGIMRRQILLRPQQYLGTNRVLESRISRARLMRADEIRLCNALRGLSAAGAIRKRED
ncbi:MAG: bifunctional anthranilate synthase component I family protein/class IV aminotransferase [Neisseria sp.]|nr:bifunctional anthranilate synthase component I family protein/class IV aminotransferase [Neisseria sp.]